MERRPSQQTLLRPGQACAKGDDAGEAEPHRKQQVSDDRDKDRANPQDGGVTGRVYAKYYVFAQFSRHIRQGCRIIGNSDPNSIVAYDAANSKLVIVTLNLDRERWVSYDLSALSRRAGPVDRWDTTTLNNEPVKRYEHATDTVLTGKAFRFRCEPNSVYTFEIGGVSF